MSCLEDGMVEIVVGVKGSNSLPFTDGAIPSLPLFASVALALPEEDDVSTAVRGSRSHMGTEMSMA